MSVFPINLSAALARVHSAQSGCDRQDRCSGPLVGRSKKVATIPKRSVGSYLMPQGKPNKQMISQVLEEHGPITAFQVTEVLRQHEL